VARKFKKTGREIGEEEAIDILELEEWLDENRPLEYKQGSLLHMQEDPEGFEAFVGDRLRERERAEIVAEGEGEEVDAYLVSKDKVDSFVSLFEANAEGGGGEIRKALYNAWVGYGICDGAKRLVIRVEVLGYL
jgi:hypothetical protein